MDFNAYQKEAARTAPRSLDAYPEVSRRAAFALRETYTDGETAARDLLKLQDILIWGQGLAGEAGEVCDLLKKFYGHGKPLDLEKLKLELGDVLWYLANLADAHGLSFSEVAAANIAKLKKRYPTGFSVTAANAARVGVEKVIVHPPGFDANGGPVCAYCDGTGEDCHFCPPRSGAV